MRRQPCSAGPVEDELHVLGGGDGRVALVGAGGGVESLQLLQVGGGRARLLEGGGHGCHRLPDNGESVRV